MPQLNRTQTLVLLTVTTTAAACAVALVTFPALTNMSAKQIMLAVGAATTAVGLPIFSILIGIIASLESERRDLRAREELLSVAMKTAKLGHWYFDARTSRFDLSSHVHDWIGDPDKPLRTTASVLLEAMHPMDRAKLQGAVHRICRDGIGEAVECRLTRLDGALKTLWMEAQPMFDQSGSVVGAYGACQDITDRKLLEAALRESEDHYRHAVELNPQISWTADAEGNILEIGPRWSASIGMTREEGVGTGWTTALHPDDVEPTLRSWSKCLASGDPFDAEYRLRLAEGSYKWFHARASARRNSDGAIVRWYGTAEDIHEGKQADVALRKSEAFARSILESSADCVKVLDMDGRLQFMNNPGLRLKEVESFDRIQGHIWSNYWPEDSRKLFREAVEESRNGRIGRFTGFCPTAKGTPKWWDVSVTPILGADGQPERVLATSRDVTAAKLSQEELVRAKQSSDEAVRRLENVLESTTDSVVMLDRDGRITFLNRRAEEVIAKGRRLLGARAAEAFPEAASSAIGRLLRDSVARRRAMHFEEFYAALDIWVEVHVYPSEDQTSIFFRDVTERRRAQEEIRLSLDQAKAASKAKSEFLTVISHELRTPLTGVLGMAEQLRSTNMDSEQKCITDEIFASGATLLTILDDILDFSSIEAGKISTDVRPADLRMALRRLESTFRAEAESKGVAFEVEFDPHLGGHHDTDVNRLAQILMNLVGNAVKFTESGAVRVRLDCGAVREDRQSVSFSVADTGIGIGSEEIERVFEPFEQADQSTSRRFGGTGLGLAISKRLAQVLGGDISAVSSLGKGSTFTLVLDLPVVAVDAVGEEADVADASLPEVEGTRVLVAEDNRVNRRILARLLDQAGCTTTFVEDGAAAVACAERQDFDIMLTDISMPILDGIEATRAIRAREKKLFLSPLPILALTAHVGETHREKCLESGMQGMLRKPFRRAKIIDAIARHRRHPVQPGAEEGIAVWSSLVGLESATTACDASVAR